MITKDYYEWAIVPTQRLLIKDVKVKHCFDEHYNFDGEYFELCYGFYKGQKVRRPHKLLSYFKMVEVEINSKQDSDHVCSFIKKGGYLNPWYRDQALIYYDRLKRDSGVFFARSVEILDSIPYPEAWENMKRYKTFFKHE